MKTNLLRGVAAVAALAGTSAFAADLPIYVERIQPAPVIAPAPMWTGFYVGGQIGYAFDAGDDVCFFDDDCDEDPFEDVDPPTGLLVGDIDYEDATYFLGSDEDDRDGGIFGGLHIGADWQFGSFVLGGVAEVNWVDFDDVFGSSSYDADIEEYGPLDSVDFAGVGDGDGYYVVVEDADGFAGSGDDGFVDPRRDVEFGGGGLDWYGTARARAGFAFGRALLYGTGGLAFGDGSGGSYEVTEYYTFDEALTANEGTFPDFGTLPDECVPQLSDQDLENGNQGNLYGVRCNYGGEGDDGMSLGWALGAGVEVLATRNFSVGVEYLYVDLENTDDLEYESFSGETITYEGSENNFHTIGVRGSYRFGG